MKNTATKKAPATGKAGSASKASGAGKSSGSKAGGNKSGGSKSGGSKAAAGRKSAAGGKAAKKQQSSEDIATGLRELFVDELKDIYWAEKALTKALPKMAKKATSQDLIDAITSHLEETEGHVARLEEVFTAIGEKAQAKKCEAMAGLVKEAEEIMQDTEAGVVRDAGIISAGQKVEHYEIATYGTLRNFAKVLGEDEAVELLQQTLDEEKAADSKLSEIADTINVEADKEDDEEGEGEESETDTDTNTESDSDTEEDEDEDDK